MKMIQCRVIQRFRQVRKYVQTCTRKGVYNVKYTYIHYCEIRSANVHMIHTRVHIFMFSNTVPDGGLRHISLHWRRNLHRLWNTACYRLFCGIQL